MSNQYELPRAVGPQRHISSKVAVNTEMIAALKFTSVDRLETHTYGLSSASYYCAPGVTEFTVFLLYLILKDYL